jgi:hypothetical protein
VQNFHDHTNANRQVELLDLQAWAARHQLANVIFEWIEG